MSAPAPFRAPTDGESACVCGAAACFFLVRPARPDLAPAAWCFRCAPAEFTPGRLSK